MSDIRVTLSNGKFVGMYDTESKTYYEQRRRNQFIHIIPAIAISIEVLDKLDQLGCKIISEEDIDNHYTEERESSQFWIPLAKFKKHCSDFWGARNQHPQKSLGFAYWYKSREAMVKTHPEEFCLICQAPNDIGELCQDCGAKQKPLDPDKHEYPPRTEL
jgi:hypothetical protein